MCGLVGAVSRKNIVPALVNALRHLEYRGYDSAGVATLTDEGLVRECTVGKVERLARHLTDNALSGTTGIAHTRWATHGRPSEINAHPHVSCDTVAVVHNGIIENHEILRERLISYGYQLKSETDSEVIAHLVHHHLRDSDRLLDAVVGASSELEGSFAIAVISSLFDNRMVVSRRGSPLLIGVAENEHFAASDIAAILPATNRFITLEEGDTAEITGDSVTIVDQSGQVVIRPLRESRLSRHDFDKGAYPHYMLKEIFEQSQALEDTVAHGTKNGCVNSASFGIDLDKVIGSHLGEIKHIQIVACGTSYHAGLVGRYIIESLAGMQCSVELASEFHYRRPVVLPNTLFVTLSQSGETADTLRALRFASNLGYLASLAICNVPGSSLTRESDLVFITQAGPEIGVASTKAFTTQLTALTLLAVMLARQNGLSRKRETALIDILKSASAGIDQALSLNQEIEYISTQFENKAHALFLGRGSMYPVAMEGSLKLKEISYIHAESYAAGELKHGPLALIDEAMPVIALAPQNHLLSKVKANVQEVRARGGELLIFAGPGTDFSSVSGERVVTMPHVEDFIAPIIYTIPLQLLAYHVAVLKGSDVDQPRNLAKSVTVE